MAACRFNRALYHKKILKFLEHQFSKAKEVAEAIATAAGRKLLDKIG